MKFFGRVWLKNKTWHIDVSDHPHVSMRIRRVFERLRKDTAKGVLTMAASPEATRELAWFLSRYPMTISTEDQAQMDRWSLDHKRQEALVEKIATGAYTPPTIATAIPLREYQRPPVALVMATGRLGLLDEMGLGKTVTAIGAIVATGALPAVVVTKTDLPLQWRAEFTRFAPELKTHIVDSGRPYSLTRGAYNRRTRRHDEVAHPDVIILNYAKLDGWAEFLGTILKFVVYDEIQELRIPDSGKYTGAKHISARAEYRLGLSASPIFNYGVEMFHVLELLAPGMLGTEAEFCREWCGIPTASPKARVKNPVAFGRYLRDQGLVLRRTLTDVGLEVPALQNIIHPIVADTAALEDVSQRAAELARVILMQTGYSQLQRMQAAKELSWRLRQATGIAKAPHVASFVRLLIESGKRVLLAGWHKAVYEIWAAMLKDLPWTPQGAEEPVMTQPLWWVGDDAFRAVRAIDPNACGDKEEVKRKFMAGDHPLLIMSLRAGAGIDGLQSVCHVAAYGELDWSPSVHKQFTGRIGRPGQEYPVMAYYLVSDDGADPIMLDVLGVKKAQSEGIVDPDGEIAELAQIDDQYIRKLAAGYLQQRGLPLPRAGEAPRRFTPTTITPEMA